MQIDPADYNGRAIILPAVANSQHGTCLNSVLLHWVGVACLGEIVLFSSSAVGDGVWASNKNNDKKSISI